MVAADARAVLDAAMTEKQFQTEIVQVARQSGFTLAYHTHDSRRSERGFPDLVLVHPGLRWVLFVEVKTEKGKLAPDQVRWRDALIATGQRWYCWRPRDREAMWVVLSGEGV